MHVCKPSHKDDFLYTTTLDFIKDSVARKRFERTVERTLIALEQEWQLNNVPVTKVAVAKSKDSGPDSVEEAELTELLLICCR